MDRLQHRLTLRLQLALFNMGLFILLCFGLVLFINVSAGTTKPGSLILISGLGFIVTTVCGGAGIYFLAGQALQPLRQVSAAAANISTETLSTRIAYQGAQDELKILADTFDSMLQRLEIAFEQQTRFVADAAHELRTPLATLRTNIEVLHFEKTATLEDYQAAMPILERTLSRLERLVADLLTLAKDQPLISEPVMLGALLDDTLSELSPVAAADNIKLHLEGDLDSCIWGDSLLLSRVFANLVENAIRYNRVEGSVTVCVHEEADQTKITVQDTGMGLSAETQTHIFDRFYRVDSSRARHTGGTGLGLSIVKHILNQHGATIHVDSTLGEGSTFTISIKRLQEKNLAKTN